MEREQELERERIREREEKRRRDEEARRRKQDEVQAFMHRIDTGGTGMISEWDLIVAIRQYPDIAALVFTAAAKGSEVVVRTSDEAIFDVVEELMEESGGRKRRLTYVDLAALLKLEAAAPEVATAKENELAAPPLVIDDAQHFFNLIDMKGRGFVSKATLLHAIQQSGEVASFVFPRQAVYGFSGVTEEQLYGAVTRVFDGIACSGRRFDLYDFSKYFNREKKLEGGQPSPLVDRASKKVLIIGPGFGRQLNPAQSKLVESAGYSEVRWCWEGLPNPEMANFNVAPFLPIIKAAIDECQPDVIACASKGGCYILGLWAAGLWKGPTLLINAHPCCRRFPEGAPVVLCQGSNDEIYPTPRARLEELVGTGTDNKAFLYYTANSGLHQSGQRSRIGDYHNQASLVHRDTLPRLLDAAMSPQGPEAYFVRTWREFLSEERLSAERWLGYAPALLRRHWSKEHGRRGVESHALVEVPQTSEEFEKLATVFKAHPRDVPSYNMSPPASWDVVKLVKVERIENSALTERCTQPYYESIEASIEEQGLPFEPGVHTTWAFHGTDSHAVDSICTDPIAGFQPLSSGSRGASLWGLGTYFARDARYVRDGGFCGQPAPDGTRRMLMCLLMTGLPCLGDPQHRGVLPLRQKPHRYHSTVDCLSSPEVFITQQSGAAHAAYLITYK